MNTNLQESLEPLVVLVTASSHQEARAIAQQLIQQKLAACVNLFPLESLYLWEGHLQEAAEWQLIIKTTAHCFDTLRTTVIAHHSYEVPEILALPIVAGSPPYLDWLRTQTPISGV
ncbi:divalent-cation tolerance protein CutA [Lyngbya confervoides]|uniref:Divalent-cation tolerance protein CutA n=1 Tax=Lyngbya confervoides BDU141951 TaxID=1574623 RepID=A0ABD4T684_9CYAN|nr:divalent-cation tolerance protein CutA [Lyngbya confervoides]MCM1984136.1 divalent-cation tolerance protein CutA [Lyngbya confervoides BDU141951]